MEPIWIRTEGQRRAYRSWKAMRQRCNNPNQRGWKNYGGRGVRISERWDSFANFLADMGEAPAGHSIDRIDTHGNYEPGNCRWADQHTQANNKRETIKLTINERTMCLKDWAAETGVNYYTAYSRYLAGLAPEAVVAPDRVRISPQPPRLVGAANPRSKLTDEQVAWIRQNPQVSVREAALALGVSKSCVKNIRAGKRRQQAA